MRKLGITFDAVHELDHAEYAKTVAELGFDCVFTKVAPTEAEQAEWANLIAKNGLAYETIHAPFVGINNMWYATEEGDAAEAMLKNAIDRCALVGAPIVIVHLSSGLTPPPVTDAGRARYTRVVEYAQKKGIIVAFENQRYLSNIAWAFETFSAADSVGFCWDCGHEACAARGREYMPLFGDRIVCTHIHDNMGDFNVDSHWIPFDGTINFHRFAEHIRKAKYTGPLTLESINRKYENKGDPHEFLARAAAAAKKLRALVDGN